MRPGHRGEVSPGCRTSSYRLGDRLYARLLRREEWARDPDKEWQWLPELAPRLSLQIPEIEATEAGP
jgi:hypothetical protein